MGLGLARELVLGNTRIPESDCSIPRTGNKNIYRGRDCDQITRSRNKELALLLRPCHARDTVAVLA